MLFWRCKEAWLEVLLLLLLVIVPGWPRHRHDLYEWVGGSWGVASPPSSSSLSTLPPSSSRPSFFSCPRPSSCSSSLALVPCLLSYSTSTSLFLFLVHYPAPPPPRFSDVFTYVPNAAASLPLFPSTLPPIEVCVDCGRACEVGCCRGEARGLLGERRIASSCS